MPDTTQFPILFARLKSLLEPYAPALVVTADTPEAYSLNTHYSERYGKEVFFGAAQIRKNYVSYYLMPVYMFPICSPICRRGSTSGCRASRVSTSPRWKKIC